jgi:2-polyprenyl-3-methyl-5-hydroxy-6-metoxy-1,4-benzoquinol methylase
MSDFDKKQADDAYPEGIEHGFWSIARHRIVDRALRNAAQAGLRSVSGHILEVGCGPGIVVAALRTRGHCVWGVELGTPTIRAAAAPYVTAGANAQDLAQPFRHRIETIMLLDVIEHIEDDISFLGSLLSAYPSCRCVLVTVPARYEVWSNYDEHFNHFRRYTRAMLNRLLEQAHLKPVTTRYFFHSLYLAAWLLNAVGRKREVALRPPSMLVVQRLIALGLGLEDRLIGSLPIPGLSLLSVASVQP